MSTTDLDPRIEELRLGWHGVWPPRPGPRVAIVGSRHPSPYGEAVAERITADLGAVGIVIVSGLAQGIDAVAHRVALEVEGITIAVMGTGIDYIYPSANADLARRIVDSGRGALVSQFPAGTPPRRENFPQRNRTIALLADVVIVVEAGEGSGSMITADAAFQLNRPLMAVPGSIFSPLSQGCHKLIKQGARILHGSSDVMDVLAENGHIGRP